MGFQKGLLVRRKVYPRVRRTREVIRVGLEGLGSKGWVGKVGL